jgi:hypothetical protein
MDEFHFGRAICKPGQSKKTKVMNRGSSSSSVSGVFHLVHFEPPPKTIKTTTESLSFFINNTHIESTHKIENQEDLFKLCTLEFDPSREEKAFILKVQILYSHNDYDNFWEWEVEKLFDCTNTSSRLQEGIGEEEGSKHPDSTGRLKLVVPGGQFKGCIEPADRLVYEPKVVHLDVSILHYVGLEHHILGARSTCLTHAGIAHEYVAFANTDPFIVFLLEYKHKFDETNAHDIKRYENNVIVKRHLVKRVQKFFQDAMFPLFHYVAKDSTIVFRWPKEKRPQTRGFINVLIQVDYIVVTPEIPKYKLQGTTIKI